VGLVDGRRREELSAARPVSPIVSLGALVMSLAKMRFEILSSGGFREIAVLRDDDVLMLAAGVTPRDLPGLLGARVRERLARHEVAIAPMV
jgi:hypothetical protein